MTTSLVVTLIGPDRPGLVSAVSKQAEAFGANWADSVMANFAGQFAGVVHLQVPAENAAALMEALHGLSADGLQVSAVTGTAGGAPGTRRVKLDLIGHDRPGIIRSISAQLAQLSVSIEKLETQIMSGAMSGEQMFQMHALLQVPAALLDTELRSGLESLANELMVDLELDQAAGGK